MTPIHPWANWPGCSGSGRTAIASPRSAAQGFADHLNAVLNQTVTDSRLSLLELPRARDTYELTRFVDGASASLELDGSSMRLFVRQVIEVIDGHCQTESYAYRLQVDESRGSWLVRWEYFRDPPRPDYPYPLAHAHVNGRLSDGRETARLHLPTRRVPLEYVVWHVIAEWDVPPRRKDWRSVLSESVEGFDERRHAP